MKKIFVLGMALLMVVGFAGVSMAGTIVESDHDFSTKGYSGGEICVVCHTPHNADTTITDAPLWNHAASTVTTYTVYDSSTLNVTVGQPTGVSKLCLSCHDGTVAIDSFGNNSGSSYISGGKNIGGGGAGDTTADMSDDHPISFAYADSITAGDNGLNPVTDTSVAALLTTVGNVECSSCHDVHNTATAADPLLRVTNAASALCLTCHNK